MRSACETPGNSSAPRHRARAPTARRRAKKEIGISVAAMASERGNVEEEALQPAHGLDLVHHAFAAVFDAGVGHLGGRYRVVARDRAGIHHAGKAHVFAAAVDGDLLL